MAELKQMIEKPESVLGMMLSELASSNIIRIMKVAGFEYVIVDCEHGYFSFSQLADIAAVGKGFGLPVVVRIPSISREYIIKVLDIGVDGILVPMVNTRAEAKEIIKYAKYTPLGARGISTTRPHTEYHVDDLKEYMKYANQKTVVMVQIETQTAVNNVEEIAAVEGIDVIFIGPNDLAADMGMPGNFQSREMHQAINKVVKVASKNGIKSGIIASNTGFLHYCRNQGMSVFCCSSEVGMMLSGAKSVYKNFWREE